MCDPCPTEPNPGPLACKATIYAVKNGMVAVNSKVAIEGVLVTARHKNGFYVQVKPGDPGYMGSDYSGAYVYDPANTVLVGDRVTLASATIQDFFGQIQLTAPTTIVLMSANEAPPDPVVVTTAQIATGGAKAAALEAVIVEVASVTVKNIAPPVGAGEMAPTNEYTVDDGSGEARVNDILYLTTPFPAVGDKFVKIRGILDHRNGNSKIEPRSAADLQGIPKLSGFGPALSFADVGQSGTATYPSPLTVTLSGPAIMDTFVAVTSGDMASLKVMGGGVTIPTGMTSATVLVDGVAAKPSVTLTATLDGSSMMANVRVLDGTELTLLTSLSPATAVIPPGGMGSFTVTLDVPAPAGGAVVSLSLVPANAGTIPATVTVPMGQISATFDYVDGNMAPSATITASLGGSMFSSTLTLKALAQSLVINEVDYDQIGTDSAEFIEIYNATGLPVDLAAYSIFLVQGADGTVYKQIGLGPAGTLADGQYLLLASAGVSVPVSALKIALTAAADNVQNGSPDAIALVNTMNNTLVDAISYEGSVTTAMLGALGTVNLVEGTPIPLAVADSNTVNGSLCRVPNGSDTNDAKTDWVFSSTPTPGAANVP